MKKLKKIRFLITLECISCRMNKSFYSHGISRYITSKNKKNTIKRLELKKYCRFCNLHIIHKEIK